MISDQLLLAFLRDSIGSSGKKGVTKRETAATPNSSWFKSPPRTKMPLHVTYPMCLHANLPPTHTHRQQLRGARESSKCPIFSRVTAAMGDKNPTAAPGERQRRDPHLCSRYRPPEEAEELWPAWFFPAALAHPGRCASWVRCLEANDQRETCSLP